MKSIGDLIFAFGCGMDVGGAVLLASSVFLRPGERAAVSGNFWGPNLYAQKKSIDGVVEAQFGLIGLIVGFILQLVFGLWSYTSGVGTLTTTDVVTDALAFLAGIGLVWGSWRLLRRAISKRIALRSAYFEAPKMGRWIEHDEPSLVQLAAFGAFSGYKLGDRETFIDYVKRVWNIQGVRDDVSSTEGAEVLLGDIFRAQQGVDIDYPGHPPELAT